MKQLEEFQKQVQLLTRKIVSIDLESIPVPSPDAPELQKDLFTIVTRIEEWKLFIPATVLYTPSLSQGRLTREALSRKQPVAPASTGTLSPLTRIRLHSAGLPVTAGCSSTAASAEHPWATRVCGPLATGFLE